MPDRKSANESAFVRNRKWAIPPGPAGYGTHLSPDEVDDFEAWLRQSGMQYDPGPTSDYDMPGFWKALVAGSPRAEMGVNSTDKTLHTTDYFKTPYHKSFSQESKWATSNAPRWINDHQLADSKGNVIFDEKTDLSYANGGSVGMNQAPSNQGIAQAAQQVQSMGRGPDTMLAHISPDEAKFIDYLQGGTRTNPLTGLPEYGLFGNILKAVARAAGAIGGFMVGGPLGAAAGSGAATKLTGGSWNDALKSAAFAGIGSGVASGIGGTGGGLTSAGNTVGTAAGTGSATLSASAPALSAGTINGISVGASQLPAAAASALPGSVAPAVGLEAFKNVATSWPGIAAGMGALSSPLDKPKGLAALPSTPDTIHLDDVMPLNRGYMPYTGDMNRYGEGPGHRFFDPTNPAPRYGKKDDEEGYAAGGMVSGPPVPDLGMRGLRGGGIQMPQLGQGLNMPGGGGALGGPGAHALDIKRAALLGYTGAGGGMPGMAAGGRVYPAATGGVIHGPGTPTSDDIPAMLSDGEHVIDSNSITMLGHGSNDKGQRAMEQIKQEIRRQGGASNVKKPPTAKMVARAKARAGVK